jgi:hypothetical protein
MPLVIIPCGGQKLATPAPASQIYTGTYFKLCLKFARQLTPDFDIRILSAKHGLLRLEQVISPYDQRMTSALSWAWVHHIRRSSPQKMLQEPAVVSLCTGYYRRAVSTVWPHARFPLHGLGGIGKQQQWLATQDPTDLRKYLEDPTGAQST